jgi:hypothetical protein
MTSTRKKIGYLLVNTRDHEIAYRSIYMRLKHRKDFRETYALMLMEGTISETGSGRKGSTKLVRLLAPGRALSD